MEPYHRLRFRTNTRNDIEAALLREGVHLHPDKGDCWLSRPGFENLRCVYEDEHTLFAIGPDPESEECTLFVYPNVRGNSLNTEIRRIVEDSGGEWGYFG